MGTVDPRDAEIQRLAEERDMALEMHRVQFERATRIEAERDAARAEALRIRNELRDLGLLMLRLRPREA